VIDKLCDIAANEALKMKLYSYVVARDYGFAPNPFHGICTLATCKPRIRSVASVGDWVVGTGSKIRGREGYIVFAMRITKSMDFNNYWRDSRFAHKKPNIAGSLKQAYGDNIYHRDKKSNVWIQENSHHSHKDGRPNCHNIIRDTQVDRVLASEDFIYWGKNAQKIPNRFRNYMGCDVCARRGHKCNFPEELVRNFIKWIRSLGDSGYIGEPLDWDHNSPVSL